jgi:DtxR family Mn-dependent transcriptional regulator
VSIVPLSDATQDYLKAIYRLERESGGVSPTLLAGALGVSLPSVTSMVKKLAARRFVSHAPYESIALTPAGERQALEVVRHHRLLETFLQRSLGYSLEDLHDEADRLEHAISPEFEEKIDRLLGRPRFDPHGEPIPDPEGRVTGRVLRRLADLPDGASAVVRRITSRDTEELRHLEKIGLVPGAAVKVGGRDAGSGIVRLEIAGGRARPLGETTASSVLVAEGEVKS